MTTGVATALAGHVMFSDGITTILMLTIDAIMSSPSYGYGYGGGPSIG